MTKGSRKRKGKVSPEVAALIAPIVNMTEEQIAEGLARSGPIMSEVDMLASADLPTNQEIHDPTEVMDTETYLAHVAATEEPSAGPATETSDELLDEVVSILEASEEPAEELVHDAEATQEPKSFDAVLAELDFGAVKEVAEAIAVQIEVRECFERAKDSSNTNIQRTLKSVRSRLTTSLDAARVMLATNVDPSMINRQLHDGQRYNVYALGKLADAIYALGNPAGYVGNKINNAVMRSLFRFKAAKIPFTTNLARAAASDKIRVDASLKDHLVRHTVAASTAPTQASSTLQAMETLGLVRKVMGGRDPVWELTDTPAVAKLQQVLAKAA
jgi:hypothetical protein